jgi:hypothetical protein
LRQKHSEDTSSSSSGVKATVKMILHLCSFLLSHAASRQIPGFCPDLAIWSEQMGATFLRRGNREKPRRQKQQVSTNKEKQATSYNSFIVCAAGN